MTNTASVLGVDVASARWRDVGNALVTFGHGSQNSWTTVAPGAVPWPVSSPLTAASLADSIDQFASENHVAAVSIDGPQGWRDPEAPASQGVGRACEKSARTPGKTGPFGRTYPGNQVGWISFSIELFERLLNREHVHLANNVDALPLPLLPGGHYYVLECFPTVTWRSAGLAPLPAKSKRPNTPAFASELASRWSLPSFVSVLGHDDLQAVVAALPAATLLGAGQPVPHGVPSWTVPASDSAPRHRVEGIIWDARPHARGADEQLVPSGTAEPVGPLKRLAELLRARNSIETEIASIIGRPAIPGHLGEYVASRVFGIRLADSAAMKRIDGWFENSPLAGRSVDVKCYGKQEGILDLPPDGHGAADFYLVITGPKSAAPSSRGATRPWVVSSVYLFESSELLPALRARGLKIGVATSVAKAFWDAAEIYPEPRNSRLVMTPEQHSLLKLFGDRP